MAKQPQRTLEASMVLLRAHTTLKISGEAEKPLSPAECLRLSAEIQGATDLLMETIWAARDLLNEGVTP